MDIPPAISPGPVAIKTAGQAAGARARLGSWWLAALPPALYALIVYPFVAANVLGEPDLERFVFALLYGARTGLREAAGFHYDLQVSFGWYAALYHLLPRSVLLSAPALIDAVNHIGFGCAVALLFFLGLYLTRLCGARVAFAAAMLFGLSPVLLELGTSGHPELPALALLWLGAWILTFASDERFALWGRVGFGLAALAVATAALTVRIDMALAFPFVTVAGREAENHSVNSWLRGAAVRLVVLAAAVVLFFVLQSHWFPSTAGNAGYTAKFLATYYKMSKLPRGLVVFVLATGIATLGAAAVMLCLPAGRRLHPVQALAVVLLALPTLAFWLPNSTPARHLLLASLAVALLVAWQLEHSAGPKALLALAVLLPLGNQACAEATHRLIVTHYHWEYPQLVSRRATNSVPIGAFPLDHDAKAQVYALLRREGQAFARACTGHVLVFAEDPRYMMISLIDTHPTMRFARLQLGPFHIIQAAGRRCTADFVKKTAIWHQDVMGRFLAAGYDPGWPIYFQDAERNPYDRTPVPVARRFCIDFPLEPRCTGVRTP